MTNMYSSNNPESNRKVVRWSPDVIVRFNNQATLPGCGGCPRKIDFQQFITSVSAGAGVTPDAGNAGIEMTIPLNFGNTWVDSTNPVLRKGLEVHIYSKGYFATQSPPSIEGDALNSIPAHPYYQIFHGIVTGLSFSQSGGFYTVSMQCSTMLHFWSNFRLVSNPSAFGERPDNFRASSLVRGNIFNGMSPYSIIYELYRRDIGDPSAIGFALNQVDNFDAESPESSFSESLQAYWDRRFKQNPYNLRMYGVSGRMFNTLQQAFLGVKNSSNQSIISTLTRRGNQVNPGVNDVMQRQLESLALLRRDSRGNPIGDLDVYVDNLGVQGTQEGERRRFNVNFAAIDPYVQDIGSMSSISMFSTEDMSKLEIASTVKDAVGYEFYQDVDGDLVFKPPFFNLNTAPSRVYRITPLDIISSSFSEAEPEATYCIATASGFQNLTGHGVENEWGIRAVYIDWRLVAQYGWRSTDLQSNFYSVPHLLYYMAAQHVDITNAQSMYTGSFTIPHRPEIRPGYPIYIEHMDCYYYVTGVDHSVAYGADCTTTLTICARRKPFYAPGREGDGVTSIDLTNTSLPPKPLTVLKPDGTIRTTGFPNVVMSLDPEQINPRYFVAGADLSALDLNDPESLPILIRTALAYGFLGVAPGGTLEEGPYQVTGPNGPYVIGDIGQIQTSIQDGLLEVQQGRITASQSAPESAALLAGLLTQVQTRFQNSSITQPNAADATLRLLSDRKASFSPNIPGRYRYYSASHPDPNMQGMRRVEVGAGAAYKVGSLFLLQEGFSQPRQFLEVPGNIPENADPNNFAQFSNIFPVAGLNILKYTARNPVVTPTHEILSLAFAKQDVTFDVVDSVQSPIPFYFNANNAALSRNIRRYLTKLVSEEPQRTLYEILTPAFDYIGPLEITGSVVEALTIDGQTDPTADFLLEGYASSLGLSTGEALAVAIETQAVFLADHINFLYDEGFREIIESNSPEQFDRYVAQYQRDTSLVGEVPLGRIPSFANYFSPTQNNVSYTVPVFPVSDADGYEVIGSFPYGRGVRIEPGASFTQFVENDPLRFADREAIDEYVRSILSSESGGPSTEAESQLLSSLRENDPGVETLLSYVPKDTETTDRTELLRIGLANFVASGNGAISKITVANAAFSLGTILPEEELSRPCSCAVTDTDIYMDSFLNNPDLFDTVRNPVGRVSASLRAKIQERLNPHVENQQRLRSGVSEPSDDLPLFNPQFDPNVNPVEAGVRALSALGQSATNLQDQLRFQRDQVDALPSIRERRDQLNREDNG